MEGTVGVHAGSIVDVVFGVLGVVEGANVVCVAVTD